MAGLGWTRRWTLVVLVLSAASLTAGEEKDAAPQKEPGRQFNSKLPLLVWARVEDGQPSSAIGVTPSEQPLTIPSCRMWWVQPLGQPDMGALSREIKAQRIPGLKLASPTSDGVLVHLKDLKELESLSLALTKVTDAGLVNLKDLKGLRELYLLGTKVTDAGLVHLKELKGLQTLELRATRVTDAGLAHLKQLKALRVLGLLDTQVTDAGVADLKKSLPNIRVEQ